MGLCHPPFHPRISDEPGEVSQVCWQVQLVEGAALKAGHPLLFWLVPPGAQGPGLHRGCRAREVQGRASCTMATVDTSLLSAVLMGLGTAGWLAVGPSVGRMGSWWQRVSRLLLSPDVGGQQAVRAVL